MHLKVGGRPDWRDFDVLLNGVKLEGIIEVDDAEGWFVRWLLDKEGKLKFNRATETVETERVQISAGSKLMIIKRSKSI